MSRIPQSQLEELEQKILALTEYDKIEISNKSGRVKVVLKSTRQIVIDCD